MKKILSAIICLILAMSMLISCGEDELGAFKEKYTEPEEEETLSLNLYIVYEEGTSDNATITVQQRIAAYTAKQYNTVVNVKYFTEKEYDEKVKAGIEYNAEDRADIVLVNSKELMNYLLEGAYLADITEYFEGNTYGTLNASIASSIVDAYSVNGKHYCVPNNYIVGEYKYLIINRDMAEYFYLGSQSQLDSFTSEESVAELKAGIQARIDAGEVEGKVEDYVAVVSGMYESKAEWEAKGFACNIIEYPTVSLEESFSAFAIINHTLDEERAMEIVYAINKDIELHNYLQYGVPHTNYDIVKELDENGNEIDDGNTYVERKEPGDNSAYYMNMLYTGDVFASYYCEELNWNEDAAKYGSYQNKQAVYIAPEAAE